MEPFLGQIMYFGGNFAIRGWATCEGQLLAINSNQALFSLLGTIYGGDGRTTFGLPDLRGRAPINPGTGPGLPTVNLGQRYGSNETYITVQNLPSHSHGFSVTASNEAGNTQDPTGAVLADSGQFDNEFSTAAGNVQMAPDTTQSTGNSLPINNLPPSLGLTALIALQGIYPSRN